MSPPTMSERDRGPDRRSDDRRRGVAPPPGGVERRRSGDRRLHARREADTAPPPTEADFEAWSVALRALGPRGGECFQVTEFAQDAEGLLDTLDRGCRASDVGQIVAAAGQIERAGLRISLHHVSYAARAVQSAASRATWDRLDELQRALHDEVQRATRVIRASLSPVA